MLQKYKCNSRIKNSWPFFFFFTRKFCAALSSGLTHTPTHTRKVVYEDDGPKRFKRSSYPREKGLKQLQTTASRLRVRFVISRSRVRVTSLAPNHPVNRRLRGGFLYGSEDRTHTLTHTAKWLERTGKHRRGFSGAFCSYFLCLTSPSP